MKDELQLINTLLCESRIFRSKQDIGKHSDRDKRDLYYSILLSTIALALDTKTKAWARQYASSAAAFANFDYFRISANDLYVLTYILQTELGDISKAQKQQVLRLYKGIGRGSIDRSFVQQILLRMERSLGITNSRLRQARRVITNWGAASPAERKTAVVQLHRFIRSRARLAEVLPYLIILTKGPKGHFGKPSALKKAAAVAGAGLAGLALGLRYDPNKRFKIVGDVNGEDVPITEARPTQLLQLVYDMRKHPEVEKIVSVNYISDGISAFVRTTDGNAYEMEIRPARYAKGHEKKRGIAEGWDWMMLGETWLDDVEPEYALCPHCEGENPNCTACDGTGETEVSQVCPTCDGLGKQLVGDEQLVFDCPDCKGIGSI